VNEEKIILICATFIPYSTFRKFT